MSFNYLTSLSPLDGRYAAKVAALRPLLSEFGLMHRRVQVEIEWFIALSDAGLPEFPPLSEASRGYLRGLVARFSEDIRPRVIDVTPTIFPRNPNELYGLREREARQWLAAKAPTAEWLAVDDAPGNWPTRPRLVLTDFKQGFTDEDAARMRRMLDAFRAGPAPAGA